MDPEIPESKSDFYQTPNLERLAAQGMRFSDAYASSPVCSPTRYSLQTGKSTARHGWTKAAPVMTAADNYPLIPPPIPRQFPASEITIAELLKTAGYATAHYGKWHLGGGGPGEHGYDEHDGDTGNRDAEAFGDPNPVDIFGISRRTATFMERQTASGKPFYIQLSHHALHYSEQSLKATQEKYRGLPPGQRHRDVIRAAMTENLDTGVGMVMDAMDRLGIAENTYLIYMSDNGGGGGSSNRPLVGGKGSLWEGGLRVPMIVRGPSIAAGVVCRVPVVGHDLFPTFCELAGIADEVPEKIDGGSLVPLWTDQLWPLKSGPANVPRRLVAANDAVYVTLGLLEPVSKLDPATGATVKTYTGTEKTEEILFDSGVLYLVVNPTIDVKQRGGTWSRAPKHVMAVCESDGTILWKKTLPWVAPVTLTLGDDNVYLCDGPRIVAFDRAKGDRLWQSEPLPGRERMPTYFAPTLVAAVGCVLYAGGENWREHAGSKGLLTCLHAKTGKIRWQQPQPAETPETKGAI